MSPVSLPQLVPRSAARRAPWRVRRPRWVEPVGADDHRVAFVGDLAGEGDLGAVRQPGGIRRRHRRRRHRMHARAVAAHHHDLVDAAARSQVVEAPERDQVAVVQPRRACVPPMRWRLHQRPPAGAVGADDRDLVAELPRQDGPEGDPLPARRPGRIMARCDNWSPLERRWDGRGEADIRPGRGCPACLVAERHPDRVHPLRRAACAGAAPTATASAANAATRATRRSLCELPPSHTAPACATSRLPP